MERQGERREEKEEGIRKGREGGRRKGNEGGRRKVRKEDRERRGAKKGRESKLYSVVFSSFSFRMTICEVKVISDIAQADQ